MTTSVRERKVEQARQVAQDRRVKPETMAPPGAPTPGLPLGMAMDLRPALPSVIVKARAQIQDLTGIAVSRTLEAGPSEDGWRVVFEMIERKAVPDTMDLLASYELHLDLGGGLKDFQRKQVRRRMDTVERV